MNFLAVSRLTANYTRPLIKFDTFFLEPRYSSLPYLIRATVNNNCPKKKLTVFPNSKLISLFVNVLERASLHERNDFSLS